jgi:L-asparaginase
MTLSIFVTGGTFDKEYHELSGSLFFMDTHLPEMLSLGRCTLEVNVRTLMMVDSLQMTDSQRQLIVDACRRALDDRIVVTHGTDKMVDTAISLAAAHIPKTIILTGAMIPYKFGSSDGLFNLGSALAFVQTLPHGVYITMNGRYFVAGKVKKNVRTGLFEEVS